MPIVFLFLKFPYFLHQSSFSRFYSFPVPIFTSLSSSPRLRFLFYSISTLSLNLRFFTCDSFSPPAISFTYCRLKQSPCPKFLQHSSVFTLSTPVLISQSDLFSTPLNEVLHEKISKTRKIPRK